MSSKTDSLQRFMIVLVALIFIILIVTYPKQSLSASLKGLDTWLNIVLPALLPFFIASEIMIELGFVDFLSVLLSPIIRPLFNCPGHSSFVWIMSVTSGYPTGPKLIASLYNEGSITKVEGQRMLAFCNNSGPLFMIGTVGIGILGNPKAGYIIAISHLLGSLLLGIIFRFYGKKNPRRKLQVPNPNIGSAFKELIKGGAKNDKSLGKILGQSVRNSMEAQLIIGGFIILFSVIINLLLQNRITSGPDNISSSWVSLGTGLSQIINPIIAGAMEITTGCQLLGEATLPFNYKLVAISLIIGWGGLSIHSQAISFLANTDLSTGVYFLSKLLHGVFSAIITYVLLWFHEVESVAAFGNLEHFINPTIGSTLIATGYLLASVVFIFIALYLIVILLKSVKIWDY
ncbi:MAG: sporulation integral membrane protein YlbJ [Caldicoprobacterales bacterium]|nr:sporulation integral membrane protein YlbJ [Clostridiales bacterium]